MSAGSRQETLTRSLIEGLCLLVQKHYADQPRHKSKLEIAARPFAPLMVIAMIARR